MGTENMSGSITIKGISQGILATLPDQGQLSDLLQLIDRQNSFFKGGQLVVDVKDQLIPADDVQWLLEQLQDRDVRLAAILSPNTETCDNVKQLGLAIDLRDVEPPTLPTRDNSYEEIEEIDSEEYGTAGVLIKRTLRSGRTVRSTGHVVIIGDVNSGAEIVAVGDIIVWGKLRGTVHAGAQGDESAVVCALDLAPLQLRIANLITIPPQGKRRNAAPEMACVSNGQIEAVPWLPK
jgi:septum site-determining protein MinC